MGKALYFILSLISISFVLTSCSDIKKTTGLPNDLNAVYLTPVSGGQLPMNELKNYPQVMVVNSFDDMKAVINKADKMVGIWIDKSMADSADKQWLLEKPQKFYPTLLIGCYDLVYSIPMRELFYDGSIDWSRKTLEKGFSYWVILKESNDSSSTEEYDEGIDSILRIEEMLRVTTDRIK